MNLCWLKASLFQDENDEKSSDDETSTSDRPSTEAEENVIPGTEANGGDHEEEYHTTTPSLPGNHVSIVFQV